MSNESQIVNGPPGAYLGKELKMLKWEKVVPLINGEYGLFRLLKKATPEEVNDLFSCIKKVEAVLGVTKLKEKLSSQGFSPGGKNTWDDNQYITDRAIFDSDLGW